MKIDKNVPMPYRVTGATILGEMKVGDSIEIPAEDYRKFRSVEIRYSRANKTRFTYQKQETHYRMWRVE